MWIKVFVKALPNQISPINSCLAVSQPDYICISNAQYSSFSVQQNLWCEIFEFWACSDSILTHSRLCNQDGKCAMNNGAIHASKWHNRASLPLQHSLCCHTKEPLFHTNRGCVGAEKRLFLYIMGSKTMQNRTKTARQISKTDFYFVITFYHLYDICIADAVRIRSYYFSWKS